MRTSRKQKILVTALCAVFVLISIFPLSTLAQTTPVASPAGSGVIGELLSGISAPLMPIILGIMYLLQGVLTIVLSWVGWLLDAVFEANITMNPGNMEVVRFGWALTRDIANSVFILIVLWIAFTIIFGIEQFGGKKLLVRTIVIALLINFSLVLVSVVFGFSNMLADVFRRQINDQDVAGVMMNAMKLQTVVNQLTDSQAQTIADRYTQQEQTAGQIERGELLQQEVYREGENSFAKNIIPQRPQEDVISLPGTQTADAQAGGALVGCGIGALFGGPFGCAGGAIAGAIAQILGKVVGTGLFAKGYQMTLGLIMSNLMLLVAIAAFAIGAVTLLVRLIMEILLSIVAPLAFIVQIIPSKNVSKYWSQWIEAVFRWAFFAPMFYFLFYLTLYMLQRYDRIAEISSPGPTVASIDFDRILQLFVALGMMFASYKLARKTGGVVAETAISWAQGAGSLALGGVAGYAGRAALPKLGALATQADQGIANIKNPVLRQMLAIPQRGLQTLSGVGRAQEKKAEKGIADMTSDEIKRAFATGQFRTQVERTAAVRKLASQQELGADETGKIKGYGKEEQLNIIRAAIDQIKSTGGEYLSLLRTNPDLARASDFDINSDEFKKGKEKAGSVLGRTADNNETAQWLIVSKMRPDHITKNFDSESLSNPVMRDFTLASWRGEHWNALNRHKPSAIKDVAEHIQKKEVADRIVPQMDASQYSYFATALARAIGMKLPAGHKEPIEILKGNEGTLAAEIAKLNEEIESLKTIGLEKRATRKEQRRDEKRGERAAIRIKLGLPLEEEVPRTDATPSAEDENDEEEEEETGEREE